MNQKYKDLRVIKYSGELAGMDGDLYVEYAFDDTTNSYIVVMQSFNVTMIADTLQDVAAEAINSIEVLLKDFREEGDIDAFAMERGIEIRDIPNITVKNREKNMLMPSIILIKYNSVQELENQIKGK